MIVAAGFFIGVLSLAGKAGFAVFPASERPMFYIDVDASVGTNLEQTNRITRMVDSVLQEYVAPEYRNHYLLPDTVLPISKYKGGKAQITWYATNVGRGNPRIYYNVIREVEAFDYAQIFVQLQEKTPPPVKIAMIDELREKLKNVPGAVINVKDFEQGPPIEAPIAIRVFGENLDTLRNIAANVERLLNNTEGTL
jgi:multidrug efflux pump subunit AcrB